MNAAESIPNPGGAEMPLPGRQFQRFILVFHFVFIFGMGFVLYNRWQRESFTWGWPEALPIVLVLAQVALYLRFFAFPSLWPKQWKWWGAYFPICFTLWFITWRIEPGFDWIVLAYLGQLFGVLPPKASLPACCVVLLVYFPTKLGWERLIHLTLREWLAHLSVVVGLSALGLFLHGLVVTSAERAKLIAELEAAQKELELAREQDAELAALRERERLARDLHDSLGHNLVTLSVQLEAAQRLYAVDPGRASALLDEMKRLTRTCMEQLRRSLAGLRAPGLGERCLGKTVQELCLETAQRSGLKPECKVGSELDSLSPAVAEALWRVAQEGLANIERHAHAQTARLVLEIVPIGAESSLAQDSGSRQAVIRVIDDGAGMPADADKRAGHYGLRGLRERVEGLGGIFTLTPGRPTGTVIEARIPILT